MIRQTAFVMLLSGLCSTIIGCQSAPSQVIAINYGEERFEVPEDVFVTKLDQIYYRFYRIRLDEGVDLILDEDIYKYGPRYTALGKVYTSVLSADVQQADWFKLGHHRVVCLVAPAGAAYVCGAAGSTGRSKYFVLFRARPENGAYVDGSMKKAAVFLNDKRL